MAHMVSVIVKADILIFIHQQVLMVAQHINTEK